MTTVASIISDAYRESNITALGVTPTVLQVQEALRLLNQIIASLYGHDAGELLTDWPLGNYGRQAEDRICGRINQIQRPDINHRLIATNEQPLTVWLPPDPSDGARMGIVDPHLRLASAPVTLDANGRVIEGSPTLVLDTSGSLREWFYRADMGGWMRLTGLAETDEMPFPQEFDTMFIVMLALRINPRYGRSIDAQSQLFVQTEKRKFMARYVQSAALKRLDDLAAPFMSSQSYEEYELEDSFGRGVIY